MDNSIYDIADSSLKGYNEHANRWRCTRYGLLYSGKYRSGVTRTDRTVILAGENGAGKTSFVNGLQYLLLFDAKHLNFDPNGLKQSNEHYFPDRHSYIVLETIMKNYGFVVFGAMGTGAPGEYEYFYYKGTLAKEPEEMALFRKDDGTVVPSNEMVDFFRTKHSIEVVRLKRAEYFSMIYGLGSYRAKGIPLDLVLFPLKTSAKELAKSFSYTLSRIFHLKISKDNFLALPRLKELLVEVCKHHKEALDDNTHIEKILTTSFAPYNEEKKKYATLRDLAPYSKKLEPLWIEACELRRLLCLNREKVELSIRKWEKHHKEQEKYLGDKKKEADRNVYGAQEAIKAANKELLEITRKTAELEEQKKQYQGFAEKLSAYLAKPDPEGALDADKEAALERLTGLSRKLEHKVDGIKMDDMGAPDKFTQKIKRCELEINDTARRIESWKDNLLSRAREELSADQSEGLANALSADVLHLTPREFSLHKEKLSETLAGTNANVFQFPGLHAKLPASSAHSQDMGKTREQVEEDLLQMQERLNELTACLDVANGYQDMRVQRKEAKDQHERMVALKNAYGCWQALDQDAAQRKDQLAQFRGRRRELSALLEKQDKLLEACGAEQEKANRAIVSLTGTNSKIREHSRGISGWDDGLESNPLRESLANVDVSEETMTMEPWPFDLIEKELAKHLNLCTTWLSCESKLAERVEVIRRQSGSYYYDVAGSIDDKCRSIIQDYKSLEQADDNLARLRSAAVNNAGGQLGVVHSSIKVLRDFCNKDLNDEIAKTEFSSGQKFELHCSGAGNVLYEAIDYFVSKTTQVDHEEAAELLDAETEYNYEADAHAQAVVEYAEKQGKVKLVDLITLNFVVTSPEGEIKKGKDLPKMASTGNAKVMYATFFLALLSCHLKDNQERVTFPLFFDEASALDSNNATELARAFARYSFVGMFSSPYILACGSGIRGFYVIDLTKPIATGDKDFPFIIHQDWKILVFSEEDIKDGAELPDIAVQEEQGEEQPVRA